MKRDALGFIRNPNEVQARIFRQIIVGLIALPVFWKLNGDSRQETFGLAGALYFCATNQVMMNLNSAVLAFQIERPIFLRE